MELSNIISFICGGLIVFILFYPKNKRKQQIEYLAAILSYQVNCGVYLGQTVKGLTPIKDECDVKRKAIVCAPNYINSAKYVLKSMEKL